VNGPTVAVVGAGITGLAAAHRLGELARERGLPLAVHSFDQHAAAGGNIRTERRDGLLLEWGPDQIVQHKPAGLALCRRLGLEGELELLDAAGTVPQVVRRGRPVRLPAGLGLTGPSRMWPLVGSPLFSWPGLVRLACEPLVGRRPDGVDDESLRAFVSRRFGRELHDRVFEPMMAGIFTADSDRLSMDMLMPQYLRMEREHRSIGRAMRRRRTAGPERPPVGGCASLAGGLGRLVEKLVETLPGGALRTRATVRGLKVDPLDGGWRLALDGETVRADAVVLACPGYVSSRLLDWDAELGRDLAHLEYASCATVNLLYPASALGRKLDGFGFFVGRVERLPILACSYVNRKFPGRAPEGHVLLRAFLGGARDPHVMELDDDGLVRLAHDCLAQLLRIRGRPSFARARRFPTSMPQFAVGYRSRMKAMVERARRHPGLALAGGVMGAIGLPDCIASGEAAAESAFEHAVATVARRRDAASSA
jgi:oxygen-dependent protoporphyrinogen oxidase